ncbi:MAG: amidohydrolase [Promethearchaeota archaeon]|nr:MAG: amidohydrolase [Candidatus Lokiarchaeota archaeon]
MFQKGYKIEYIEKAFKIFKEYGFYERMAQMLKNVESIKESNIIKKTLYHVNKAKLKKVVLLPVSSKENKLLKEWIQYAPDVFIPFYNPPEKAQPNSDVKEQMERELKYLNYKGLKLMISFRNKHFNDRILEPILEMAQSHKLIVLMHTGWPPPGTKRPVLSHSNPVEMDAYFNSFPKVKFVIAHMGFPFSDIAIALATQYPNVYLDISNLPYMAPLRLRDILLVAKDIIGTHKILFGTDGFVPEMIEIAVEQFERIDILTKREKEKILGLNAMKILGL